MTSKLGHSKKKPTSLLRLIVAATVNRNSVGQ